MKAKQLEELRADLNTTCEEVLLSKGKDYAGEDSGDRLANFKMVAGLLDMFNVDAGTPEGTWAVYFLKHVFAILAYIGQRTESEPVKLRFVDARNYLDLGYALVEEGIPLDENSNNDGRPLSEIPKDASYWAHGAYCSGSCCRSWPTS